MDIFSELHQGLPREGPGDPISTAKAFQHCQPLDENSRILDIGCGPGMQTRDLANLTRAIIIALDTNRSFLLQLRSNLDQIHDQKVNLLLASMFSLPFGSQQFDVIWSEGAVYIYGFENGLRDWKQLLKPGGTIAVTELTWLKPSPPEEIFSYWHTEYPGIHTIQENLAIIASAGYQIQDHFILPDTSWSKNYYDPIASRLKILRERYAGNSDAQNSLDLAQLEIDMFDKYSEYYGYVFYIAKA